MKKILSILVAICAYFAAMAQNPMVTLSHDGELTFFTDVFAFESAYKAAADGDTLYLSEGEFVINGNYFTISKYVTIIGSGYGSYIPVELFIFRENEYSENQMLLFDGVRIKRLDFNGNYKVNIDHIDAEIRNCWIESLEGGADSWKSILYDKCYIENADFGGSGNHVKLQNCKLNNASWMTHISEAINCNMSWIASYPLSISNCIISSMEDEQPACSERLTIINSLLNFTPNDPYVNTHGCYIYEEKNGESILNDNMECTIDLVAAGYLGSDGKVVGIHGGTSPFSENPSVPTVDSDNSSVEYDANSNILKVSITVKTE